MTPTLLSVILRKNTLYVCIFALHKLFAFISLSFAIEIFWIEQYLMEDIHALLFIYIWRKKKVVWFLNCTITLWLCGHKRMLPELHNYSASFTYLVERSHHFFKNFLGLRLSRFKFKRSLSKCDICCSSNMRGTA